MSIDESLSDIVDVEPMTVVDESGTEMTVYVAPPPAPPQTPDQQVEEDANLVRDNIKSLLNKGGTALDSLINISTENQHPRSFEVVATMLKTLADINHNLLDTHKKKRDLVKPPPEMPLAGNTTVHVEKGIFFGSTAELSAKLKAEKESSANGHSNVPQ